MTTRNPYTYRGSGWSWKPHIKKHGNDVDTYIIGTYETRKELREAGIYYSKIWNVIESDEWANRIPEGGSNLYWLGKKHTQQHKNKIRNSMKGIIRTPEHRKNNGNSRARDWKLIDPQGKTYFIHNLQKFCDENGFKAPSFVRVASGQYKQYKGWKCQYA